MPAGLQIFDSNGSVLIDTNERLARFLGTYQHGSYGVSAPLSGQLALPSFESNVNYWYVPKFLGRGSVTPLALCYPVFVLNGSMLSWTYTLKIGNGVFNVPFILFYGVY